MDRKSTQWQRRRVEPPAEAPLRSVILESWQRSREAAVDPKQSPPKFRQIGPDDLKRRLEENADWLALASPHLDWLGSTTSAAPFAAYLIDREGVVLHSIGSPSIIASNALAPGFDRSEKQMGTNGAGTALATEQPVAVIGREHFLEGFRDCTGTAAPIRDPEGRVIGAIDITTPAADASPERLTLVAHSAHLIEREIALQAQEASLRHAHRSSQESEQQLRCALSAARMVAWDWNLATGVVHRSENASSILGLRTSEPDEFLRMIHPDDRTRVEAAIAAARGGEAFSDFEFRVVTGEGHILWVLESASLRVDPVTEQPHLTGICMDLTDRKQAELRLRESAKRFRQMANTAPVVIWVTDRTGYCTFINEQWTRLSGQNVDQALGFGWTERIHPDDRQLAKSQFITATEKKTDYLIEYRFMDPSGVYRWAIATGRPRLIRNGTFDEYIGCILDISEHRQLEERLRQSQKMEAFGQLAGGVAHDFNNLLTIISGNSETLSELLPSNDPCQEFVREISTAGKRAASLTQQLLAFSRQTMLAPKILDLNAVVSETEKMLRRLIGEDIRLTIHREPKLRLMKLDPGQCEQILINLAVNARDAMPKGGQLTIETANVTLDDHETAAYPEATPGDYVRLTVKDTGNGMTPEIKSRLFEPYFTTKRVGKGTGLGLAVVHGIVNQNSGLIQVTSEPGAGAIFELYFPAVEGTVIAPKHEGNNKPKPGSEFLLLVEDEDAVRRLLLRVLQQQGYKVLVASNGREALELVKNHHEPLDLLVTDVVMPELGGPELAHALCPRYPDIKVLFVSGHTDDAMVRHGLVQDEVAFLQKPFSPLTLVKKVREVLDAAD